MRSLWDQLFKNDLRRAVRELKECGSFVRIRVHRDITEVGCDEIYHVTQFEFKENRMHFFMPDRDGNFATEIPSKARVEFLDAGNHDLILHNHEFNRKLAANYYRMDKNREEYRGKRLFLGHCARTNNPIYLTTTGVFHKLRHSEDKGWPELPFKIIGLHQQARDVDHYYAYTYYAIYGTAGIVPNMSASWEPDPYYKSFREEQEEKLIREYNEYLKADHFKNGDLIQEGNSHPVVFIRYTDPERTGMMVYPNGEVKGIRRVLKFKLIQRNYRPDLAKEDPVSSN